MDQTIEMRKKFSPPPSGRGGELFDTGENGPDYGNVYFVERANENKTQGWGGGGGLNDNKRKPECSPDPWRKKKTSVRRLGC